MMEERDRHDQEEGERDPPVPAEPEEDEDHRVDREADETFPASDPPANY